MNELQHKISRELSEFKKFKQRYRFEFADLKEINENNKRKIDSLIGSLEEYDKREQDREQKIDLLSKENDELKEVIISAEADILSLQRKCKEISEQSKQQSLQMNELNEALIQLRDINEESISHLDKAQEEIESLTNQIKEKEKINHELNNNNNVLSNYTR